MALVTSLDLVPTVYSSPSSSSASSSSSSKSSKPSFLSRLLTRNRLTSLVIPYFYLARWHKPIGAVYLFLPCLFGILLASLLLHSNGEPAPTFVLPTLAFKFFIGCFLIRSQGCAWNDILDRKLDRQVARTHYRPIAGGQISVFCATAFCIGLLSLFMVLVTLSLPQILSRHLIIFLVLGHLYPLAKRVTYFPQAVLGVCFSYGVIIAFEAMGMSWGRDIKLAGSAMFAACTFWTVLYDSIYAAQDLDDDLRLGAKSTMVLFGREKAKSYFRALELAVIVSLLIVGKVANLSYWFYGFSCGCTWLALTVMINRVDLRNGENCAWWFKNGAMMVGVSITTGLLIENLVQ